MRLPTVECLRASPPAAAFSASAAARAPHYPFKAAAWMPVKLP